MIAPRIRDGNGTIVGVVLVFRDIADRKQAEQAIQQSEERFERVVTRGFPRQHAKEEIRLGVGLDRDASHGGAHACWLPRRRSARWSRERERDQSPRTEIGMKLPM